MKLTTQAIEGMVTAVLAVNSYPVARVQRALPELRAAGLFHPETVAVLDLGVLTVRLASNGYDRGMLTSRIGERLKSLMAAVVGGQLDELSTPDCTRDRALAVLQKVKGIGPTVAHAAWVLMQ